MTTPTHPLKEVEPWVARHQRKDLLRLLTCGSVDDGKSTLIGRLLYDSEVVYEDQAAALKAESARSGSAGRGQLDLSLLLDGLKSEREQGITIDVAYRYFTTDRRKFIIADTPGHEQYTRNMATGASTADLAVILIDACQGVTTQTRRHAFIVSLLGIPHVVVAVNKMDLVGWNEETFEAVREEYSNFAAKLIGHDLHFIPVSALHGDNVVERSQRMPWYSGSALLDHLETVSIASDTNLIDLRLPVQYVLRPDPSFRGYCGRIASGSFSVGQELLVVPAQKSSKVARILGPAGEQSHAFAGQSVTVVLADEVDISRGDMLVRPGNVPEITREFEAMLIWMSDAPLEMGRQFLVRTACQEVPGIVAALRYQVDIPTLGRVEAETLQLNEIGRVHVSCMRQLTVDSYRRNRRTGAFILIDRLTNATVAAGLIRAVRVRKEPSEWRFREEQHLVSGEDRRQLLGQAPATVWLTGLPRAGKRDVAAWLERQLMDRGHAAAVLLSSTMRQHLSRDLGFSAEDRSEQVRRLAATAHVMNEAGLIAIVAAVSPYAQDREAARQTIGADRFFEVHCAAPLQACEANDTEGLYARARAGELENFTGISAPYEAPEDPELELPTHKLAPPDAARTILEVLDERGCLKA